MRGSECKKRLEKRLEEPRFSLRQKTRRTRSLKGRSCTIHSHLCIFEHERASTSFSLLSSPSSAHIHRADAHKNSSDQAFCTTNALMNAKSTETDPLVSVLASTCRYVRPLSVSLSLSHPLFSLNLASLFSTLPLPIKIDSDVERL